MQQEIVRKFLVSELIASELAWLNYLSEEQDTFHRQPIC